MIVKENKRRWLMSIRVLSVVPPIKAWKRLIVASMKPSREVLRSQLEASSVTTPPDPSSLCNAMSLARALVKPLSR